QSRAGRGPAAAYRRAASYANGQTHGRHRPSSEARAERLCAHRPLLGRPRVGICPAAPAPSGAGVYDYSPCGARPGPGRRPHPGYLHQGHPHPPKRA
nr:hypothetical protein [Tanacetum cinerariifolium]